MTGRGVSALASPLPLSFGNTLDLDSQLCFCFHIPKRKIVNFVTQTRPRRASQISECFGAGTGCGWCIPFLKRIHRQVLCDEALDDDMSLEEYEKLRSAYLLEVQDGVTSRNEQSSLNEELPASVFETPAPADDEDPDWDVTDYFLKRNRPPEGNDPDDL